MKTLRQNILCIFVFAVTAVTLSTHAHEKDPAKYITDSIIVEGRVEKPVTLSVDDLAGLPQTEIQSVPMRCGPDREKGQPSDYSGVLLRDLLEYAGIDVEEHHSRNRTWIAAVASDDYAVVFSWHEIFNSYIGDGALVVIEENGRPLEEDGRIGMISAKDNYTCGRHVKWLQRIDIQRYKP